MSNIVYNLNVHVHVNVNVIVPVNVICRHQKKHVLKQLINKIKRNVKDQRMEGEIEILFYLKKIMNFNMSLMREINNSNKKTKTN